jgi:SAM-dependent methyltransferase
MRMDRVPTLDEVMQQGRDRLFPPLTDPNWLVLRERRRIFTGWLGQTTNRALAVLDVGGRIQPYRPLLTDRIRQYFAVDLLPSPLVNVIASAERLPFRESYFDLVVCTQMLPLARDPVSVIAEIFRVLKPGGKLWLSVPSALPDVGQEHWRFLPAGLRSLLAAFRHLEMVPEGGSVAGLFRTMNLCFEIFARYPPIQFVYRHSFCPLLNLAGAALERASGGRNQQFTVNYSVQAEK